eukprot:TRINITY_DN80154_c0_g1_i1.p1 TRINITY_DN80154_c0_g1~~TRINITY_DN80154_c0_g1_i1.p1  ORF type:complete len:249 (+),score=75.74 TRINITY_DN80154_c0_g1_i1:88-834(+)
MVASAADVGLASPFAVRQLCDAQERRVKQLQELNMKKEEKLLQLHVRLDESLTMLQAGQKLYADQQKRLEEQEAAIARTKARVLAAKAIPPTPDASPMASPTMQGSSASHYSRPSFNCYLQPVSEEEEGEASLVPQAARSPLARGSQPIVIRGGGGAGAERARRSAGPPAEGGADSPSQTSAAANLAREMAMAAAPELLQALGALTEEKSRLEAQLADEQSSLEGQLTELRQQMELLATLEAEAEPID